MKTIIISLLALVAIAFGGHWYYKAQEAKRVVATQIDDMSKNDPDYRLTHDAVTVKGFPLSYEVTIPNAKLVSKHSGSSEENVKEIQFDGSIIIGTDLWGTAFWIEKKGTANIAVLPSNNHFVANVDSEFSANVANPEKMQAFNHPFSTALSSFFKKDNGKTEINWERIKKGEIKARQFNLKGVNGEHLDQELIKFDRLNLTWTRDAKEENIDLSFLFDLKGLESKANLDKVLQDLVNGVTPLPSQVALLPSPPQGKTDVFLDAQATLPKDFDFSNLASYKQVKLKINKFDVTSNWGQYHLDSAFLFDHLKDKERKIHLDWNSQSVVSKEQHQQMVSDFISYAKNPPENSEKDPIGAKLHQLSLCCEEDLKKVIPDYTNLSPLISKMLLDIDISDENRYNVDLKQLDFAAKPYGFYSKGQALLQENHEPKGIYKLEFKNYQQFIQDLFKYYNNAIPVLNALNDNKDDKFPPLASARQEDVVHFLKAISDDPDKTTEDLHITVNFLDIQNLTIGTLTPADVQMEWEDLMRKFQESEPAAQTTDKKEE